MGGVGTGLAPDAQGPTPLGGVDVLELEEFLVDDRPGPLHFLAETWLKRSSSQRVSRSGVWLSWK
jgi:hypothetical protein